jgi:hypothetical protein
VGDEEVDCTFSPEIRTVGSPWSDASVVDDCVVVMFCLWEESRFLMNRCKGDLACSLFSCGAAFWSSLSRGYEWLLGECEWGRHI